jgi:hypothetical protein
LELGREFRPSCGPRDRDVACFQGLAQGFQSGTVEFRKFVKKQHAMVSQRDFTRWALTKLSAKPNEVARNFDEFIPNDTQSVIPQFVGCEQFGGLDTQSIVNGLALRRIWSGTPGSKH